MVLEGWIIFHLLFEIGGLLVFLAVGCRRLLELLSCCLYFIVLCPRRTTGEVPRPIGVQTHLRGGQREYMRGKIQIFELDILVREGEGKRDRPESVYLNEQLYP